MTGDPLTIKSKYQLFIYLLRTKSDEFQPVRYADIALRLAAAYEISEEEARRVVATYRLAQIRALAAIEE